MDNQNVLNYEDYMRSMNMEGLTQDIVEDDGYERWDLCATVMDNILTDVYQYMDSGNVDMTPPSNPDKDFLYSLMTLISHISSEELLAYLPKDNLMYKPEVCGEYRLDTKSEPHIIHMPPSMIEMLNKQMKGEN